MASTSLITSRISPQDYGVTMGAPSEDAKKHAKDRLTQQMRLFGLLCAMRMNGNIKPTSVVTLAKTELQHGQGGVGQQAAHKVIASLNIDDKSILDYCGTNHALHTFLVFLLSETTVLPRGYNMADQDIEETGGLRNKCITLAQFIVNSQYEGELSEFNKYKACLMNTYADLKAAYTRQCGILCKWSFSAFEGHSKELEVLNTKRTEQNKAHFDPQIDKKKINCSDDLYKVIAFDFYLEVTLAMDFPLLDAELENMFETVTGRPPSRTTD